MRTVAASGKVRPFNEAVCAGTFTLASLGKIDFGSSRLLADPRSFRPTGVHPLARLPTDAATLGATSSVIR